ncbi:Panacea domain-containing protein [Aliivibrio logei]|uniref:Panacea domain-containing protein n=1 Tax=Aliivibrio logei TaxID=688 RepID=UPI0035C8FCC1
MTYIPNFDEDKTAQLAAYLTSKSGGEIYHLMLMKLLYISDRNALATLGHTISDDNYASMNYGPVLLNTLSLIDGSVRSTNGLWSKLLSPSRNYKISLLNRDFDTALLSEAELAITDAVFSQFGSMDRFELADKTHEFGEWNNPHGSILPIDYQDILKAVGFDDADANSILQELQDVKAAKDFLNNL